MDHVIETTAPGSVSVSNLPDWALSHGVTSLSTKDVRRLCGIPANQVSQRMAALRKGAKLFSPARGLWVPIPPEYRTWGAPEPMGYIADMIAHLGTGYLVGWLSAAERHGASHHAAQVFQVATGKTVRARTFGRSRLGFYSRSYVGKATASAELRRRTGVRVASPGTTMLMLAADLGISGGISNVANLVIELAEERPEYAAQIIADAPLFRTLRPGDSAGFSMRSEMVRLTSSSPTAQRLQANPPFSSHRHPGRAGSMQSGTSLRMRRWTRTYDSQKPDLRQGVRHITRGGRAVRHGNHPTGGGARRRHPP